MENTKKIVLDFFKNQTSNKKNFKYKEIKNYLAENNSFNIRNLRYILILLEHDGLIYHDNKGKNYRLFPSELGYIQGEIEITNNEGIIKNNDNIYKIKNEQLNNAENGDLVVIKILDEEEKYARVQKVIEKKNRLIKNNNEYNCEEVEAILLNFFENPLFRNKKYKFREIRKYMFALYKIKVYQLKEALDELEHEGLIYYDDKTKYYRSFPHELGYVQGNISINKHNEGFIENDSNEKCKIRISDLNGALNGDTVVVKKTNHKENGYYISKVIKVVERKDGLIVVEAKLNEKNQMFLEPFNAKLDSKIEINNSLNALVEGDRLLVKINYKDNKTNTYYATYVKYFGHKDDPDAEIKMIAVKNGINIEFSEEARKEAEAIPTEISKEEKRNRINLTDEMIFSIDGAKTKDRDDAISLSKKANGNYLLGVHIADVSHYVHPPMKLWNEALERGTSAYLVDTVIPMLPHKLSNGICSLNPNVERLSFSCLIELDSNGNILNYDFVDTIIKSKKAMTYEDVNEYLENNNIVEGYEEYIETLDLMQELAEKLEKNKVKRGYVDFGSNDIEITMNEEGNPEKIEQLKNHKAQKIIENFMLAAGECAANYVVIPSPYRIHEQPDEERVEEALDLIKKSGIKVKSCHEIINGKVIQQLLAQIKNTEDRKIAANIILRSMKRAKYSVENIGHFGLGLSEYGQFTSPIRRANDLVMHHIIRMQRDNKFNISETDDFYKNMSKFCNHVTKKEQSADNAERDANQFAMSKYIDQHLGEKFTAKVTYVNSHGIYIKTIEGIDGVITVADLAGDKFTYDERTNSFIGKKSRIKIKIGSELYITAVDTKREYKTINFGLEEEDFMALKMHKKS